MKMICNGSRRSTLFISRRHRWRAIVLRNKRTITKSKSRRFGRVQDVPSEHLEALEFPFTNPDKSADCARLEQCMEQPLCFDFEKSDGTDGNRFYEQKYPSVTTILQQTKPANEFFALRNWQKAQIIEHGEKKFKEMSQTVTRRGSDFHQDMHEYLSKMKAPDTEIRQATSPHWDSVQHVLEDLESIVAVESAVIHPSLHYAGTLDLVAHYNGELCVIDWKTSQKPKTKLEDCFSYPHQIAAYAGAVNYSDLYPFQVNHGLIVIAYKNGDPADVITMPPEKCEEYWRLWLTRLQEYKLKFPDGELIKHSVPVVKRDTRVSDSRRLDQETAVTWTGQPTMLGSIGTPLKSLGKVVREEDFVQEETLWEKIKGIFLFPRIAEFFARWKELYFLSGFYKKREKP